MASHRRPLIRSILVAVTVPLAACGDSGGPSGPDPLDAVASVTVTPALATVDIGSSTQLNATVRNGRGETMTTAVSWSSSAPSVASCSASGLVAGVTEGSSTITASAGGQSGTAAITVNDPFPPQQPSNVVATPVSNTEIQVTWTDNSGNEDEFRIDREQVAGGVSGADGGPALVFVEVGIVGPNVTAFSDTGLQSGTAYSYRVRACNENGCSDPTANADDVSTFTELVIETTSLAGGQVGVAYEQTLTATGGDGTYVWSVGVGVLPDGLSLGSSSGVISGTPSMEGTYPFTVQVQSGGGQTTTKDLSVEVVFVFSCSTQSEIPQAECEALESLYEGTNGAEWTNSTDWLATPSPCSWHGVTCSTGSVTGLGLNSNGLTGPIPAELGNLANLQSLSLQYNQLTGAIPSELGTLANLQSLSLHASGLSGAIPSELGNLANLQSLSLHINQLAGVIPSELGNLANLTSLRLSYNQLTGSIPSELGNLASLEQLHLSSNQLTGAIPSELGNLAELISMYLHSNQLTGAIPSELGNLSDLRDLFLQSNQLTGTIPPELGNLANLEDLYLEHNPLTGAIPPELGNLSNLDKLALSYGQLTGGLPSELGNLTNLRELRLMSNQLTGAIPPELGNMTNLQELMLSSNQLSGGIPPQLGNLSNLTYIYFQHNQLTGAIPTELGNLSSLQYLRLESNLLTGTIPPELGNLANLRHLFLDTNQLTGAIPSELGNLANLEYLHLQSNQLTGAVPLAVAQLGGVIQNAHGANNCDFLPGNTGLNLPDTQAYRDADLDADGFICEVAFPPGPFLSALPFAFGFPVRAGFASDGAKPEGASLIGGERR